MNSEENHSESEKGSAKIQEEASENRDVKDLGGAEKESAGFGEDETLDSIRGQIGSLQDQLLRAQAETENVRRRAAKEHESLRKFAVERLIGDLLPVLDSLEKAVEAADDTQAENPAGLSEGIKLSLKLFTDILEKSGLIVIDPLSQPFDPDFHEALTLLPSNEMEPNSVLEVVQKGYSLNGRVIRAAKVVVSSNAD